MTILLGCLIVNTTSLYPHWSRWPSISCGHAWRCLTTLGLQVRSKWYRQWVCAGFVGHTIDFVQMIYLTSAGEPYQQTYYRSQTTQRVYWLDFFWMMVVQLHCMTVGRVCLASYSIVCKSASPQSVHSNLKQINLPLALCGEGLFVCWFK